MSTWTIATQFSRCRTSSCCYPATSSARTRARLECLSVRLLLLSRLELVEAMTLKELSQALTLDTSTVHRQVAALLRSEYVHYVPGLPGEVARRLAPTAAGLAALVDTRAINEEDFAMLWATGQPSDGSNS